VAAQVIFQQVGKPDIIVDQKRAYAHPLLIILPRKLDNEPLNNS
jgi:hypothetical protein